MVRSRALIFAVLLGTLVLITPHPAVADGDLTAADVSAAIDAARQESDDLSAEIAASTLDEKEVRHLGHGTRIALRDVTRAERRLEDGMFEDAMKNARKAAEKLEKLREQFEAVIAEGGAS